MIDAFLSTPSARRATLIMTRVPPRYSDFYPRPPRGGRPKYAAWKAERKKISIHALREEGDRRETAGVLAVLRFLSTPSARRATIRPEGITRRSTYFYPRPPRGGRPLSQEWMREGKAISIHALREEGDSAARKSAAGRSNFYPRPPRGGRPNAQPDRFCAIRFLSTPSSRRAWIEIRW